MEAEDIKCNEEIPAEDPITDFPVTNISETEKEEEEEEEAAGNMTLYELFAKIRQEAAEDTGFYEVNSIIGKRLNLIGEVEYLVTWKNYLSRHNAWTRKADMSCDELLETYEKANQGTETSKEPPLYQVGDATLVTFGSHHRPQYCWVKRGQNGKLKCRGIHKYDCLC